MPENERESRIGSILRRAEKLTEEQPFNITKGHWLVHLRPQFREILLGLELAALGEEEWPDPAIRIRKHHRLF